MFRFKQFNLIQENCPMKFGTDSMTLAGFVPLQKNLKSILDIGSGSGIIALIMAQRTDACIDAIEIDSGGFVDMKQNFRDSKWESRIQGYNTSLQTFKPKKMYDLIISNPPFFSDSLKSNNKKKMGARHTEGLPFAEIILFSKEFLTDTGVLAVILPEIESINFIDICRQQEIPLIQKISIQSFPHSKIIRHILIFSFLYQVFEEHIIAIYKEEKVYTDEYRNMLSNYFI